MNFQGSSGVLIVTPNVGQLAANPSPYAFPVLQECSAEFKGDLKMLYGQYAYALDGFRGKIKVTGKGKMIVPPPDLLGQIYFGLPTATGVARPVFNEQHAIASSVSTSNIKASVNLGVINGNTGDQMQLVASSPAAGQYTFTPYNSTGPVDGSYGFSTADVTSGFPVRLSYTWADTAGQTIALTNELIGAQPQSSLVLFNTFKGKLMSLQLNAVVFGSFSIPTKQEDYWISDFDYEAFADQTNTLGSLAADL
jgi:hypothetical protein